MGKQMTERKRKAEVVPFFQDGQYFYKKGLKAYHEKNLERAGKWMQRAADLEPNDPEILSQLAMILSELGQYKESNDIYAVIIETADPEMSECHYFMANNFAHLGLFHEAYKCAMMYSDKEPDGDFLEENEDLLDLLSIEGIEEDMGGGSDELILKQDAAKSLLENGNFEEAIELLEEIVRDFPEFWSAYNNLSLAHFYKGNVKAAKKYLDTVLTKSPGNLHALCNLLVFYYYERQDNKVLELSKRLGSIYPILIEHRYKLGATFALVGQYALAYRWLRSLQRQGFDGDDTFYYWLASAAYYTGNQNTADYAWQRVVEINPSKAETQPWKEVKGKGSPAMLLEERFAAIFLAAETGRKEDVLSYQEAERPKTSIERAFIDYVLQQKQEQGTEEAAFIYFAARLFVNKSVKESAAYIKLFRILLSAAENSHSLKNYTAWSAAAYYLYETAQGRKATKLSIAEKFGISSATLAKYQKLAEEYDQ
ncbi:tetratricopeptide repeat protein [Metabacillus lacus]|uniref:tetratricopeptide repeat protein n=1 Tax=Metabacillus lacus TaxID=1983721 RepID=UPI001478CCEA